MRNFKELRIWQRGMDIAVNSFELTENFPKEEKYGLSSQITVQLFQFRPILPREVAEGAKETMQDLLKFL